MTSVRTGGFRWRTRALARGVRGFLLGPPPPPPPPPPKVVAPRPPSRAPGVPELVRVTPRPSVHESFRLNLIVPSVAGAATFGGIQTAIDLFRTLSSGDVRRRLISIEPFDDAIATAFADFRVTDAADDPDEPSQLVSMGLRFGVDSRPGSIPVGPRDVFIATFWPTALVVLDVRAWQAATYGVTPGPFAYLVQDFEPGFYPRSASSLLAASTY